MSAFLRSIGALLLICGFVAGCVTIPSENFPTYNLAGINYVPLTSLCQARGINLDYDYLTKIAVLNKGGHKINLRAGEKLVLADNRPIYLDHEVTVYQGILVVPLGFKTQILDSLFKEITYIKSPTRANMTRIKRIIVDAGHGGYDPGAIGRTGVREKNVTLDIAKRLVRLLKNDGFVVEMTRSTDRFVTLESRVSAANRFNADLFISVHANANPVRSLKGFEVYYVSPKASDAKRSLAAAQDYGLNLQGSLVSNPSLDLKALLWNMVYTYSRSESIELARSVCRSTKHNLDSQVLGVKAGNYYVLKGAKIPAVLIEVGFLSNKEEERYLQNSYFRQRISESINQGILDYAQDISLAENLN
jgi:N-acetylmuramoyl-L-alanine amidase